MPKSRRDDEILHRRSWLSSRDDHTGYNPRSAVLTGHGICVCLDTEFAGDGGRLRLNSTEGVSARIVAPNGTVIEFRPIHPIPIYNDAVRECVTEI